MQHRIRQAFIVLQKGLDEALRISGGGNGLRKSAVRQEIARERVDGAAP